MFWTKANFGELIKTKYPWYLDEITNSDIPLQFRREARYFILNEHGGIFVNMDYQVLKNFFDLLPKNRPSLLATPYRYTSGATSDVVMSSPPGHPLWNITFSKMKSIIQSRPWFTSPQVLEQALEELDVTSSGFHVKISIEVLKVKARSISQLGHPSSIFGLRSWD